jgi:hypothetical protein
MWNINEKLKVDSYNTKKINLYLKTENIIDAYNIKYPILWSGLLNNLKVEIIQKEQFSSYMTDYDFLIFPIEYIDLKGDVISIIDKYLRILD